MNEHLMNIFTREIISRLPRTKKNVYQFIEGMEDQLASQCETKEQFLTLLAEKSPYQQAADRFHMSLQEMHELMKAIEDEINNRLDLKIKKHRWIDYTDKVLKNQEASNQNKKFFLFVS
ncbi:hypothetical protein [Bacillus sp. UMB0893]|uniref:hypothetical protein n=1 Tax=Bacillus sp. UMB0893 TaxID=2066053 RepID=UPI000C75A8FD|nr:hypothetical protein [Bacillus sp. UMB0893]PLR68490.1 hypothetical protein CYJ36_05800 [Bacillus sp. UMB0893]QNG60822.1 hypothetical protein H4O14_04870 [Bacillus sp. PAMC26568]